MPDPFSFNPWGLNPWAAEPARDAAQAPSLRDVLPPVEPWVAPSPLPPPTGPRTEFTYETEDWFQSVTKHWPAKGPVIPAELHVNKDMSYEVGNFVNRHVKEGEVRRERLHCFDFAAYQLHVAGHRTGGRPSQDPRSLQILVEDLEDGKRVEDVRVDAAIEAVLYIKEALDQEFPVLIGLCLRKYQDRNGAPARPNDVRSTPFVEPTNHYVVIVEMGRSDYGVPYFRYYDYHFRPQSVDGLHCRLYLKPSMKLEAGQEAVAAEVRRTMAR